MIFLVNGLVMMPVQAKENQKIECNDFDAGCRCYTPGQLKIIATGIQDLKKCEFALAEKERLIEQDFVQFKNKSDVAWWQEPNFVAGGVVLSFSLGLTVGILFLRK
jgi:hypothetical protein